jgi:redox-sensitive bicupin YhaK (pirin superfamily)
MSAGSGITHSEANASKTEPLTLFQIWVFPKLRNIAPRYDQRTFNVEDRNNKWQMVVSPKEEDNALWINQDARFSLAKIDAGITIDYTNGFLGNGIYLVVISGNAEVNGIKLKKRDALGIWECDHFSVTANEETELLAIEVPMGL